MLITTLIELLAAFLVALFQRWISAKINPNPTALAAEKQKFLNKVRWRFWLGPDRIATADKVFNASLKRYKETVGYVSKIQDAKAFSEYLTSDLTVL